MEIVLLLECSENDETNGNKIIENCVSDEMKELILEKYSAWIEVSPKLHRTFSFPPS